MGDGRKGFCEVSNGGFCCIDIEGACSILPPLLLLLLLAAVAMVSLAQAQSLYNRSIIMYVRLQTGDSERTVQSIVHPWPG